MNQADVTKLVSKLRLTVNPKLRKFRNPQGPEGRLDKLRKTVTALIKHERIELNYPRADEARMYAERLISDAIRYGDCHNTTMEMADYWLLEKQLVHKLFKVLVPRYEQYTTAYTRLLKAPRPLIPTAQEKSRAVLELKGNPYPSLLPDTHTNRNLLHNVLLDEARKAYRNEKYKEIAAKVESNIKENSESKKETKSTANEEIKSNEPEKIDAGDKHSMLDPK